MAFSFKPCAQSAAKSFPTDEWHSPWQLRERCCVPTSTAGRRGALRCWNEPFVARSGSMTFRARPGRWQQATQGVLRSAVNGLDVDRVPRGRFSGYPTIRLMVSAMAPCE